MALFADSIDFLGTPQSAFSSCSAWVGACAAGQAGHAAGGSPAHTAFATLSTAPAAPAPVVLTLVGAGALAINLACTLILVRYHSHGGSLTRAAFLSIRNDVLANAAATTAGMVAARLWPFAWLDLIAGLGVAAMNAGAAREVWVAAREQHGTTA
ncbi:cation transporter [Pseudoroseomonas wenyumeiae]